MRLERTFPPFAACQPSTEAADLVAGFLAAWDDALAAYERLLAVGIASDDAGLARDMTYKRLLKAGQTIRWVGGEAAVANAARLIARQVPSGDVGHFQRLWSGLLPNDQV